jgi:hypothetical protein
MKREDSLNFTKWFEQAHRILHIEPLKTKAFQTLQLILPKDLAGLIIKFV